MDARGLSAAIAGLAPIVVAWLSAGVADGRVPLDRGGGLALRVSSGVGLIQSDRSGGLFASLPVAVEAPTGSTKIIVKAVGRRHVRVSTSEWHRTIERGAADIAEGVPDAVRLTLEQVSRGVVGTYAMSLCPVQGWHASLGVVGCGYPGVTSAFVASFSEIPTGFLTGRLRPVGDAPGILPDGPYRATVALKPGDAFPDRDRRDNIVKISVAIALGDHVSVSQSPPLIGRPAAHRPRRRQRAPRLPDLVASAPEQLELVEGGTHRYLRFDSLFWNSGNTLALDGERTGGRTMLVRQRFVGHRGKVRYRAAGRFIFERNDGHHHWHFRNAARYELITRDGQVVRRSGKIGFCIGALWPSM